MDFTAAFRYARMAKDENKPFIFRRECWPDGYEVKLRSPSDGLCIGDDSRVYPIKQEDFFAIDWVVLYPEPEPTPDIGKPFEWALTQLKAGAKVQKKGWKNVWLVLIQHDEWSCSVGPSCGPNAIINAHRKPWIGIKTFDGGMVPWTARPTDLLANDWCEVK